MEETLKILKARFESNMNRHKDMKWEDIEVRLRNNPKNIEVLKRMESTGGEPDVVEYDAQSDKYYFYDCSKESPTGRRSICYDQSALDERKENKPQNSAIGMAVEMGIEIMDENQYRKLQKLGEFDLKTSTWIKTPAEIRQLGGALFCDRRYNSVFVYHNGASSYYASRGFRGVAKV